MLEHTMSPSHPAFTVTAGSFGTTRTLTLTGELDISVADELHTAVERALAMIPETIVIDLSGTEFIDSTGVRALLHAHRETAERSIRLVIVPAPETVQRVFTLCGLETTLPFAADGIGHSDTAPKRTKAR